MTLIDILVVSITVTAVWMYYKYKKPLKQLHALLPFKWILVGLSVFSIFYLADLVIMFIFPMFMPIKQAMAEMRNLHLDYKWIISLIGVGCISGGTINLFRVIFPNISRNEIAYKEMVISLKDALDAAQAGSRTKSVFLETTSHEVRTPLNSILGMAEVLAESNLTEEQRSHLSLVQKSGKILLSIVNDILDLSKIEAGKLELKKTNFHILELILEIGDIFSGIGQQKGLSIINSVKYDVPQIVKGDPIRIKQILFNLVGNAIKFTQRGSITISVEVQRADRPGEEGMLLFSVQDTGLGIPYKKQALIFEPFTQADDTSTREHGGTGLGLAICKRLVEQMEGRLGVKSELGKGSTFFFTIQMEVAPLDKCDTSESPTAAETNIVRRTPLRPQNILLADDTEENRLVVKAFLYHEPHILDLADNGKEALKMFQVHHYDLVLMDIQMPIMDGYTATRRIRQWQVEHQLSRTPIIAVTASAMKKDQELALESGCDYHLSKPISKAELLNAIERFCS